MWLIRLCLRVLSFIGLIMMIMMITTIFYPWWFLFFWFRLSLFVTVVLHFKKDILLLFKLLFQQYSLNDWLFVFLLQTKNLGLELVKLVAEYCSFPSFCFYYLIFGHCFGLDIESHTWKNSLGYRVPQSMQRFGKLCI